MRGQLRRFVKIVGDEHHRHSELFVQPPQFHIEPLPRAAIHSREGLIQQQHLRLAGDCSRERHALLLSTREFVRVAPFQPGDMRQVKAAH